MLHRVKTSSAFPSAHVFPGGNLSNQDGEVPPPEHKLRHDDSDVYRHGALRELFEESGILLAVDDSTGSLIHLSKKDREMGRREIHGEKYHFKTWCKQQRAKPHIGMLESLEIDMKLTTADRGSHSIHALGHPYERAQTLYNPNVLVLPTTSRR